MVSTKIKQIQKLLEKIEKHPDAKNAGMLLDLEFNIRVIEGLHDIKEMLDQETY